MGREPNDEVETSWERDRSFRRKEWTRARSVARSLEPWRLTIYSKNWSLRRRTTSYWDVSVAPAEKTKNSFESKFWVTCSYSVWWKRAQLHPISLIMSDGSVRRRLRRSDLTLRWNKSFYLKGVVTITVGVVSSLEEFHFSYWLCANDERRSRSFGKALENLRTLSSPGDWHLCPALSHFQLNWTKEDDETIENLKLRIGPIITKFSVAHPLLLCHSS